MNKALHAVVLVWFGTACWFVSLMLKLPLMGWRAHVESLPAFTRFCMGFGPWVLAGLALVAAVYCIYVWARKAPASATWVGFLATATSALVLVLLPVAIALYLPLVDFVNRSASR